MTKRMKKKVVVFIDCQKDFVKNGKLAFGYPVEDNMPKVIEFAEKCVADGFEIYATRDTHERTEWIGESPDGKTAEAPVAGYLASLEGKRLPVEHCIEGTDGWMLDERLIDVLDGHATFINKPTFGCFDLAEIIEEDQNADYDYHLNEARTEHKEYDIDEIILCGYCTSICVMANAVILRAKFPDVKISIKEDCCGCVNEASHKAAIEAMRMQQIDII